MGVAEWTLIGVTAISLMFTVFGYLLSRKDAQQEKELDKLSEMLAKEKVAKDSEIARLWNEHGKDVERLNEAEIKLAGHPNRDEMTAAIARMLQHIDSRFEDMKGYITDRRKP